MKYFLLVLGSIYLLTLTACGGGGSSETSRANPLQTGVFLDSPVSGLYYETATQSGTTSASGEFQYLPGESVTFSLGGITLGSSSASGQVTPLDLVGANSIEDAKARGLFNRLVNLLVFLQSLDRDHNPDNGIDLTDLHAALVNEELNFDTIPSIFHASGYKRIVNEQNGFYQSIKQAQNHFIKSLGITVSTLVPLQDEVDLDGDGEVDFVIDYKYDSDGRLIEATEPADMATSKLSYDASGNLSNLTFGELDSDSLIFTRTYVYDTLGRNISEVDLDEGFADNIARTVTTEYDEKGNITRRLMTQNQTNFELDRHLSTFDSFYIFPSYDPNFSVTTPFPLNTRGRIGPFRGNENIRNETLFTYDDAGNPSEIDRHYEYTKTGETDPWAIIDERTLLNQGNITSASTQIILPQIIDGFGSADTNYTYSELDNAVNCNVTSTGIFGETAREQRFENADEIEVLCSIGSMQETKATVNESGLITAIEISDWVAIKSFIGLDDTILENEALTDDRTKIELRAFEYNERGQVTEARQTITQKTLSSQIITTGSSQRIVYTYRDSGELQSRHDYVNDQLVYSQSRSFQTLNLEQLN